MKKREKRAPTFTEAILPLVFLLAVLIIGKAILGYRTEFLLSLSAAFAAIIGFRLGYSWDEMMEGVAEKIAKTWPTIMILVVVGAIVSTWMFSGTTPLLIYYGIQIINPKFLYICSFIICAIISTCCGTSWGTMATIGVVLVVIADGLGVSVAITAGAVVSGSYFGDKMSPLSDTTNLAPIAAGSNLYEHIGHMFYTTLPAALGACVIYLILGFSTAAASLTTPETVTSMLDNLSTIFKMNVILALIPVAIIIYGSVTRKPTIPVMGISAASAMLIGIFYQGFSLKDAISACIGGFSTSMIPEGRIAPESIIFEVSKLLNRGGFESMMETVLLIICAFAFAGIISKTGCLEVILQKMLSIVKTRFQLIASTAVSTILMALATGSDFLTILLPGELFRDAYKERGLAARNLSRTLEDCGTCVVALVPWSAAGVYAAGVLGVPTTEYLPFAFFGMFSVVMAFVCAATGFGIMTLDQEAEKAKKAAK